MKCPICGKDSVEESYDICENCSWEYDSYKHWWNYSSPNHTHIITYRIKYWFFTHILHKSLKI